MTENQLPHSCMLTTYTENGHLFVIMWCKGPEGQHVTLGFNDIQVSTADVFSQLGMHVAHIGKHGWTTIDETKRLPL